MFKYIDVLYSYGMIYRIVDSNFIESQTQIMFLFKFVHTPVDYLNIIIPVYKDRHLNVPLNMALCLNWCAKDYEKLEILNNFRTYKNDVEKYLNNIKKCSILL